MGFSGDKKISPESSSGRLNRTLISRSTPFVGAFRRKREGDSGGFKSGDGGSGIVGIEYSLGKTWEFDGVCLCREESNR